MVFAQIRRTKATIERNKKMMVRIEKVSPPVVEKPLREGSFMILEYMPYVATSRFVTSRAQEYIFSL